MFNHLVERGRVLWEVSMSLDGYISGPGDAMDWLGAVRGATGTVVEDAVANLGAVVVGRRTWGRARAGRAGSCTAAPGPGRSSSSPTACRSRATRSTATR
jgi:dihydrofolate reductase